MITREKKQPLIAELVVELKKACGVYVIDFTKMTVAETTSFRRLLRAKGIKMKVAKNTLIERALEEVDHINIPFKYLVGQSALVFSYDDPTSPSKLIKEASAKSERPKLKAAVLDGQFFEGKDLNLIASLPSREEIMSGIVGSINAPISGIVGTINAVMAELSNVIEEVAKKQHAA